MTAGRVKKNCFKVLDEMSRSSEPVLITRKGKPMVKLVSADAKTTDDIFGCLRDTFKIVGDITAVPLEDWEALRA